MLFGTVKVWHIEFIPTRYRKESSLYKVRKFCSMLRMKNGDPSISKQFCCTNQTGPAWCNSVYYTKGLQTLESVRTPDPLVTYRYVL